MPTRDGDDMPQLMKLGVCADAHKNPEYYGERRRQNARTDEEKRRQRGQTSLESTLQKVEEIVESGEEMQQKQKQKQDVDSTHKMLLEMAASTHKKVEKIEQKIEQLMITEEKGEEIPPAAAESTDKKIKEKVLAEKTEDAADDEGKKGYSLIEKIQHVMKGKVEEDGNVPANDPPAPRGKTYIKCKDVELFMDHCLRAMDTEEGSKKCEAFVKAWNDCQKKIQRSF